MNLAKFPRRRYTQGRTPIEKLSALTELLGGPEIYVKRDDLLGLSGGGNKTRKLEFVVADAIEKGCDTLITCGAVQSNHCRLTLSAAVREGLKCHLVLEERVPGSYSSESSGNNFLFQLLGVESITVVNGGSDMMAEMEKVAGRCEAEGFRPYIISGGASNPIGATGYVACAQELGEQLFDMALNIDHIVVPSGSAGTHSGMLAGVAGTGMGIPITGISVSRGREEQENLVHDLAVRTAEHVGCPRDIKREDIVCHDDYVGGGYSIPTDGMVEAVTMLARAEGILLDPVYTGKTMAGLIDLARKGRFKPGERVLFLHTGGSPALFQYMDTFREWWLRSDRSGD